MAEIHVEHRKRGQLPPFALIFHLEMNSLLEPVEGSGEVDGSLEILITPPPNASTPLSIWTGSSLDLLETQTASEVG